MVLASINTVEYLFGPDAATFRPAVIAGIAVAFIAGLASPIVVLKRLAFVGQGVSHAAFGGMGLAAAMGLSGAAGLSLASSAIVGVFCLVCAGAIAFISRGEADDNTRAVGADAAIGVVLVASMALGAMLLSWAARNKPGTSVGVEEALFGSVLRVTMPDAMAALVVAAGLAIAAWHARQHLLFWAYDAPAAKAFGVPTQLVRMIVFLALGLIVVVAVKLVGVILTTALLVVPGMAALLLSSRLWAVFTLAAAIGVLGTLLGLFLSFEINLQPGATISLTLIALLAISWATAKVRTATGKRSAPTSAGS